MTAEILEFTGEDRYLSNFDIVPVFVFGRTWKSSEHAFQAAKFFGRPQAREHIEAIYNAKTPGEAKRLGRQHREWLRPAWDAISIPTMAVIVLRKFEQNAYHRDRIVATRSAVLVEGNSHGDRLWGAVWQGFGGAGPDGPALNWASDGNSTLVGRNELGKILMVVRDDLRHG